MPIDVDRLPDRPGDHRYYNGVLCCAKGEADSCCADYEYSCSEHGGRDYRRCLQAGESTDFKFPCVHCCAGLEPSVVVAKNAEGVCMPGPPSVQTCHLCGDGICSRYEECTCPEDCP